MGDTFSFSNLTRATGIGIRIIITAFAAIILMLMLSFPSTLVSPQPTIIIPEVSHEFLVEWKNWLWVAPWLLMELAAVAGPRRNLVWFSGLLTAIVLTMLAYPVIHATRPELIVSPFRDVVNHISLTEELNQVHLLHEDSAYRDQCLSYGFPFLWILLGLSAFVRLVVLGYLTRIHAVREENEFNMVDMADISPDSESARTVREIAADKHKVQPKFKFGEADQGLIAHFRELLHRMQYLRTLKGIYWLSAACLVAAWFLFYPQPNKQEALERDLKAMFETTADAEGNQIGTTRAVYAALRVMHYAEAERSLDNRTVAQAEKWLGLGQVSPDYRTFIRNEQISELEYMPMRLSTTGVEYARFLTITDGRLHAVMVLNLRTNEKDPETEAPKITPNTIINFPQYFEFGWDMAEDKRRSHPYINDEIYQFNNASFI